MMTLLSLKIFNSLLKHLEILLFKLLDLFYTLKHPDVLMCQMLLLTRTTSIFRICVIKNGYFTLFSMLSRGPSLSTNPLPSPPPT